MKLIKKMYTQQLVDVWRITHPSKKDYTFHLTVHDTYSRLDYILVDHGVLKHIIETTKGTSTISDHAPATVNIRFKDKEHRKGTWRLNEDLIDDAEVGKIITELDMTKATIWEAHKVCIRGKFISIGAWKKKEREKKMEM